MLSDLSITFAEYDDPGYIVSIVFVAIALLTCGCIVVFCVARYIKPNLPKIGNNANRSVHAHNWPNSDIPFVNMDTGHNYG